MMQIVKTKASPEAIGPYSQAVKAGGFVFTSGILPLDPLTGKLVAGGVEEQTRRTLLNLQAVLEAAGSSLSQVVKTTVFITNMKDFPVMNKVYGSFFDQAFPARATVEVSALALQAEVEIQAVGVCDCREAG